jgi:hypothetical protein
MVPKLKTGIKDAEHFSVAGDYGDDGDDGDNDYWVKRLSWL